MIFACTYWRNPKADSAVEREAASPLLAGVTIFLSAFLLFQLQPILAKMILPWFGGSAAVWTTCVLFSRPCCFSAMSMRTG